MDDHEKGSPLYHKIEELAGTHDDLSDENLLEVQRQSVSLNESLFPKKCRDSNEEPKSEHFDSRSSQSEGCGSTRKVISDCIERSCDSRGEDEAASEVPGESGPPSVDGVSASPFPEVKKPQAAAPLAEEALNEPDLGHEMSGSPEPSEGLIEECLNLADLLRRTQADDFEAAKEERALEEERIIILAGIEEARALLGQTAAGASELGPAIEEISKALEEAGLAGGRWGALSGDCARARHDKDDIEAEIGSLPNPGGPERLYHGLQRVQQALNELEMCQSGLHEMQQRIRAAHTLRQRADHTQAQAAAEEVDFKAITAHRRQRLEQKQTEAEKLKKRIINEERALQDDSKSCDQMEAVIGLLEQQLQGKAASNRRAQLEIQQARTLTEAEFAILKVEQRVQMKLGIEEETQQISAAIQQLENTRVPFLRQTALWAICCAAIGFVSVLVSRF